MKYRIHWLDGRQETVEGENIADAFSKAGLGAGALPAVDWYEELPLVMTEEQYLAANGHALADLGDPALHRMPGLAPGNRKRENLIRNQLQKDQQWLQKRNELRAEYQQKLETGEIRQPTKTERLIATANGHPDNESVQAARRILHRMGVDWKEQK